MAPGQKVMRYFESRIEECMIAENRHDLLADLYHGFRAVSDHLGVGETTVNQLKTKIKTAMAGCMLHRPGKTVPPSPSEPTPSEPGTGHDSLFFNPAC